MLKKTLTYKNFNDEEETEDFWFNLTESELVEVDASIKGGLEGGMKRAMDAEDNQEIINVFKAIIKKAYGVRSADGKRFRKNDELFQEFESSGAYNQLFLDLFTGDNVEEKAAAFMNAIAPNPVIENTNQLKMESVANGSPIVPKTLTRVEAYEMNSEELKAGLADGRYVLS